MFCPFTKIGNQCHEHQFPSTKSNSTARVVPTSWYPFSASAHVSSHLMTLALSPLRRGAMALSRDAASPDRSLHYSGDSYSHGNLLLAWWLQNIVYTHANNNRDTGHGKLRSHILTFHDKLCTIAFGLKTWFGSCYECFPERFPKLINTQVLWSTERKSFPSMILVQSPFVFTGWSLIEINLSPSTPFLHFAGVQWGKPKVWITYACGHCHSFKLFKYEFFTARDSGNGIMFENDGKKETEPENGGGLGW